MDEGDDGDDGDGHWVTIDGDHVFIKGGSPDKHPAAKAANEHPAIARAKKDGSGSWMVKRADNGQTVGEISNPKVINAFNPAKVTVTTIREHLSSLNANKTAEPSRGRGFGQ